jgi:hypothetical protein
LAKGVKNLTIYRNDTSLVMHLEEEQNSEKDLPFDEEQEKIWQAQTQSCFTTSWKLTNEIFNLDEIMNRNK